MQKGPTATKSKPRTARGQAAKPALAILKKSGLYKGDLRRSEPSRYAVRLAEKFADVASGRAQVVAVPHIKSGRSKGARAANERAASLASEFSTVMRSKGSRVIVRTAHESERAHYSRATQSIITTSTDAAGRRITREYVHTAADGALPVLGENQAYSLPFSRGKDGVFYIQRADADEILAVANQYETKGINPYRNATGHIQIATIGNRPLPRKRKSRAKPKTKRKTAKVINLSDERRKRRRK